LSSHIQTLRYRYNLSEQDSIKIFLKWPGIINIVNLSSYLTKLEFNLNRLQLPLDQKYIKKLLTAVPRVVVQNISKKYETLSITFPNWDIRKQIIGNPRILTQKLFNIKQRYNVSQFYLIFYRKRNYFFFFFFKNTLESQINPRTRYRCR